MELLLRVFGCLAQLQIVVYTVYLWRPYIYKVVVEHNMGNLLLDDALCLKGDHSSLGFQK